MNIEIDSPILKALLGLWITFALADYAARGLRWALRISRIMRVLNAQDKDRK